MTTFVQMKYIEKLQYVTNDIPQLTHIEQAQLACEAGAKWIRYRCLSKTDDELLADINAIAEICDDWGTTLVVSNHVHLNGQADIQGFHIENLDADFIALRKKVGINITLGGFANTTENLIRLANEGADYVDLGPFAATKTHSLPSMGIDGFSSAITKLKGLNIEIPVLAAGGITVQDVKPLMQAGIYGIAVSEAINQAADFTGAYQDFYDAVKF